MDTISDSVAQNQGQLQQLQQPTSSQQLVVVVHETKEHTPTGKSIKQEVRSDHRERTPTNGNGDFLGKPKTVVD